jgi:hypothetical protein
MSNPDTILETQNFVQVSAGAVLITPTGGTQTDMADLLAALDAGSPSVSANGLPTAQLRLPLLEAFTSTGIPMTASASSSNFGISLTLGTSIALTTNAANSSTVTNTVAFEVVLPATYVAGSSFSVIVDGNYNLGSGTLGTNTLTATAYNVSAVGAFGSNLITSAAKAFPSTAGDLAFTCSGTGVAAGGKVVIKLVAVIQDTAGSNITAQINSIRLQ